MANFSKSFNFRNGLQVDNDKFIVKPTTGLVGIGSTAPTEVLDVVGNIKATGITSARDIFAGAGITVGYANSNRIMLDIDPLTGVSSITAQRFYGDGSNMSGIFAISVAGFVQIGRTVAYLHHSERLVLELPHQQINLRLKVIQNSQVLQHL